LGSYWLLSRDLAVARKSLETNKAEIYNIKSSLNSWVSWKDSRGIFCDKYFVEKAKEVVKSGRDFDKYLKNKKLLMVRIAGSP